MAKQRVEELAGFVVATALLVGLGGLVLAVILLFSAQWIAAGISLLAAAVIFSSYYSAET
jgi:hypothetical protein